MVGRYQVIAGLGRGAMGRVLLASGPDGRLVALKLIHQRFAEDDGFRVRFRREVDASRRVSGAYTAAVVDADTQATVPWLASVHVPGPTLDRAVATAGPLPEAAVLRLAAGLAAALIEVQRVGLVHRDVKPSNVLLTDDGPRLIDFGIARPVVAETDSTGLTQPGTLVGSPAFMSPEQAQGQHTGQASDVFSLGAALVLACTGTGPFTADSVPLLLYRIVHTEPDLSAVPPRLRPIVEACLYKAPEARPTPAQLLDALGGIAPSPWPWPPAVQSLISDDRARLARLLHTAGASETHLGTHPAIHPAAHPATPPPLVRPPLWRRKPLELGLAATAAAAAIALTAVLALPSDSDGTTPTTGATDVSVDAELTVGSQVSFKTDSTKTHLRHFRGRVVLSQIDDDDVQAIKDATWTVRTGLANVLGHTCYSFEASHFDGEYLHLGDGQKFEKAGLSQDQQFKDNATFCVDLLQNGSNRIWMPKKHNYLRLWGGQVYVADKNGKNAWDTKTNWQEEITWVVGPPIPLPSTYPPQPVP
ncbi:hypothetical protein BU198_28805 [Streptomyces sp. CBMA156]|nr:hypothetical protein [Streptomyces sp. CBMA156]